MKSSCCVVCSLFHNVDVDVYAHQRGRDCSHFLDAMVSVGVIENVDICHLTMNDVSSCVHFVSVTASDPIEERGI